VGGTVCSGYETKEKCELPRNLDMTDSLCLWDSTGNICNYNPPNSTFLAVLILTTLVTVFILPLNMLCEYLIRMSAIYIQRGKYLSLGRKSIVRVSPTSVDPIRDERNIQCVDVVADAKRNEELAETKTDILYTVERDDEHALREELLTTPDIFESLKQKIDSVSAEEEVADLCSQWHRVSGNYNMTDNTFHTTPEVQKFLHILSVRFGITRKMLDSAINQEPSLVEKSTDAGKIYRMILKARELTIKQKDAVLKLNTLEKKQIHIMRAFISDLQPGQKKKIALKFLFANSDDDDEIVEKNVLKHTLCTIFLVLYILGTIFYIFLFGVSIGQHETILWLQVLGLSALQSIFIVKPLVIWVQFIATTSMVSVDLQDVLEVLKSNASARAQGLEITHHNMISESNFLQHLNTGCRLARVFPELPVSKVLVSLRDVDLPDPSEREGMKHSFMKAMGTLFLLMAAFLIAMSQIPEGIQNLVFSIIFTVGTNCVLFSTFFVKEKSTVLPVIAALLIVGAFMIRQYILMQNNIHFELKERKRKLLPTGTKLREALPRNAERSSAGKQIHTRKMFKEAGPSDPLSSKSVAREKIRHIIRERNSLHRK